jgi:hypothetical protein
MRRFTFTTTATPQYSGEGVDWEDGSATYRIKVGTVQDFEKPFTGAVADLTFAYGGLPGYSLTYSD